MKGFLKTAGLTMVVLVVLVVLFVPKFLRESFLMASQKACIANQRVLAGAVEMYHLDHPQEPLDESLIAEDFRKLKEAKVLLSEITGEIPALQEIPYPRENPPRCRYRWVASPAEPTVVSFDCPIHGSVDHPATKDEIKARLQINYWCEYAGN